VNKAPLPIAAYAKAESSENAFSVERAQG